MYVTCAVNLGSRDAAKIGVDYTKCLAGETLDIPDAQAKQLCDMGVAYPGDPPSPAKPAKEPKAADQKADK